MNKSKSTKKKSSTKKAKQSLPTLEFVGADSKSPPSPEKRKCANAVNRKGKLLKFCNIYNMAIFYVKSLFCYLEIFFPSFWLILLKLYCFSLSSFVNYYNKFTGSNQTTSSR